MLDAGSDGIIGGKERAHLQMVMEHGKPIVTGTPDVVRNDERVIKAYLGEE